MRFLRFFLPVALLMSFCPVARAELPPWAYENYQREAPEALVIKVLSVKARETKGPNLERVEVEAEAQVERVVRSRTGLVAGKTIRIAYVREFVTSPGGVGPSSLPVLKEGEVCPAYLARSEGSASYAPAARGYSFREVK